MEKLIKVVHITTVDLTWVFFEEFGVIQRKYPVKFYAISAKGPLLDRMRTEEGFETISIPFSRKIEPLKDFKNLVKLTKILKNISPQIVHTHTPKAGLIGTLAAKLANVPICIYQIHGLAYETPNLYKKVLLKNTEKISCFLADKVFAVSRSIMKKAIQDKIVNSNKIQVIAYGSWNCVNFDKFSPLSVDVRYVANIKKELGIEDKMFVIGYIGRINKDKGVFDLLKALQKLDKDRNDWFAVFIGPIEEVPNEYTYLYDWATKHKRIFFNKKFELNINVWYYLFDLFVFPTYREGLPNSLLEASAMQKIIITTKIDPCMEIIKDNYSGFLFEPRNVEELYNKIKYVINNKEKCKNLGLNARQFVQTQYNRNEFQEELMKHYKFLLSAKNAN